MRHGSLFSGIGGFELAAEWMGWENTFHCEFNEFGSKVLNHYWPESKHYGDITKSDFSEFRDTIDILTGGFPCQPYSAAGKRKGKDDARHLWPEMLRVIREVRPRYIVGENVYGLVTWNGGIVFDEVCTDLEAEGYAVWPIVIPAAAVNAPHRRDRVWFVAYSNRFSNRRTTEFTPITHKQRRCGETNTREWNEREQQSLCDITSTRNATNSASVGLCDYSAGEKPQLTTYRTRNGICEQVTTDSDLHGCNKCNCDNEKLSSERRINAFGNFEQSNGDEFITDSDSTRLSPCTERPRQEQSRRRDEPMGARQWDGFPTESPVCSGNDGISDRLDGITFSKWRNESIKAYGNAIVPQVVYQIFKAIEDHDYRAMA
jgi:DNA (cytosine-5)-methyltransferase 1